MDYLLRLPVTPVVLYFSLVKLNRLTCGVTQNNGQRNDNANFRGVNPSGN